MMFKLVGHCKTCFLILASCVALFACQAPQVTSAEVSDSNSISDDVTKRSDQSEGLVGPDEAFFVHHYLEQVFQYSNKDSEPDLAAGDTGKILGPRSAFDFAANFTDKRLDMMAQALFLQGDRDRDAGLTEEEFRSLELDPQLFGLEGERRFHKYSSSFFQNFAGTDQSLQKDECQRFLRSMGPKIQSGLGGTSLSEQHLALIKAWEKVLDRFDDDKDQKLSLTEQRDLRRARSVYSDRLQD